MGFEILHEWEPNDKVKGRLKLYQLDHIVVGFDGRTGQRKRGLRRDGKIVDTFNVLVNVQNLYYRCVDAGACSAGLDWLLVDFEPKEHVDVVFENARYMHLPWLTWWFDRFYLKEDAESQFAYFNANLAYESAYPDAWKNAGWDMSIVSNRLNALFDDWKDAVRDFYLPALRAWVITYDPDRPYIRV